MKLAWTCKQWFPGITTFRGRDWDGHHNVLVGFSGGPITVDSGYLHSHEAAAEWAAAVVGSSLNLFAAALRGEGE